MKEAAVFDSLIHNWFVEVPKTETDKLIIRQFEVGEILANRDGLFQNISIVLDGICNVINQLDNGSEIITLKLTRGDLIGVSESILNHMRHLASVKACTTVVVAEMNNAMFKHWLASYPCFVDFVLKNLVTRLHYTADFSANCQTSAPKINLAKYLIDRYNVELTPASSLLKNSVRIPETHEMICNFLGISPRSLDRYIHALKADGLINTSGGKICISSSQYQNLLHLVTSNL